MLEWQEENGLFLGFDDGALFCRVYPTAEGWTYDNIPEWVEYAGYTTAEEAQAVAEEDFASWTGWEEEEEEEEGYTLEDAFWDHWEWVMEDRRAQAAGLYD